jgi:hypothetical protein
MNMIPIPWELSADIGNALVDYDGSVRGPCRCGRWQIDTEVL